MVEVQNPPQEPLIASTDIPTLRRKPVSERLQKKEHFSSINQIIDHIKRRGPIFFGVLRQTSLEMDRPIGWENLFHMGSNVTKRDIGHSFSATSIPFNAEFTGKGLCVIGSMALYEALRPITSPEIKIEVLHIYTDFNAETWNMQQFLRNAKDHAVLRITEAGKEPYIIDTTYGQVHHGYKGDMVCIPEHEMIQWYDPGNLPLVQHAVEPEKENIDSVAKMFQIRPGDYRRLVSTVTVE